MHGMISSLTVVELSIMISRQETCVREDGIPVNIEIRRTDAIATLVMNVSPAEQRGVTLILAL